jgi:hypothetical protein
LLQLIQYRRGSIPSALVTCLAVLWVPLVIGRYLDVTVPAIFGRPINLYWDARHLSAVFAMLARPASWWIVILTVAAAVLVPLLLFWPSRWALRRVATALGRGSESRALTVGAGVVVLLFAVRPFTVDVPYVPQFGAPVLRAYADQATLLAKEITRAGTMTVAPSPPLGADLSRVQGADVFIVFIESYGAVAYDSPQFASVLANTRSRFDDDIRASGRKVVSAFVDSPTFGGSSWLAHISLLSGIEVRDEDTNIMLLAEARETMVTSFARKGFRTIAMMPGLQQIWPEGAFYGFDEIYRGDRLEYKGPDFGWWSVPDQFSLARLDQAEVSRQSRPPLFVFFPTISTHAPFSPIAPYQADWARVLTATPYDEADLDRSYAEEPDWMNLAPSYLNALSYDFASIGGYLRLRADRDFVMVVIGDHQPAAAVAGEGAPWDVPVHIVSSRQDILTSLEARGFRPGLMPARPAVAPMHTLTTILLEAFSSCPLAPAPPAPC